MFSYGDRVNLYQFEEDIVEKSIVKPPKSFKFEDLTRFSQKGLAIANISSSDLDKRSINVLLFVYD